ncbi:MAG: hypothetical protein PHG03_00320 [Bacilli bacterium]|nr:hypothetical protein [Bacilli bacterium]MDD4794996.1 hypothetical protein [Bacilli bacterium]
MKQNCANCNKNNLSSINSQLGIRYDSPIFSFQHLVSNNKYNFSGLPSNEFQNFCRLLIEKIYSLEKNYTIKSLFNLRKPNFFESFPIDRLYFKPKTLIYSKDTKVYVFRVTSSYRMICMYSDVAPIFHVIGFDFGFNAYDHGD